MIEKVTSEAGGVPNRIVLRNMTVDAITMERISLLMKKETGIQLPTTKRSLIESRLGPRLRVLGLKSFAQYLDYSLQPQNEHEKVHLIDLLTTNKTYFFREQQHFDFLNQQLIPHLQSLGIQQLKVWSAGCSSGEEAYSLAMTLAEANMPFEIHATDISARMVHRAKQGVYPAAALSNIPKGWQRKYLLMSKDATQSMVRVKPELRRNVKVYKANLMEKSSYKFHLIFCRNVLIYFDAAHQKHVVDNLSHQLRDGGYLVVGHSETLFQMQSKLTMVHPTIYHKNTL